MILTFGTKFRIWHKMVTSTGLRKNHFAVGEKPVLYSAPPPLKSYGSTVIYVAAVVKIIFKIRGKPVIKKPSISFKNTKGIEPGTYFGSKALPAAIM